MGGPSHTPLCREVGTLYRPKERNSDSFFRLWISLILLLQFHQILCVVYMTFSVFLTMDLCQTLFEKSTNTTLRSSHMLRAVAGQSVSRVLLFVTPRTAARQPGFQVLHCLLEVVPTLVHPVGDAIQPSHPLLPPSPPAFSLSQHQGLSQ